MKKETDMTNLRTLFLLALTLTLMVGCGDDRPINVHVHLPPGDTGTIEDEERDTGIYEEVDTEDIFPEDVEEDVSETSEDVEEDTDTSEDVEEDVSEILPNCTEGDTRTSYSGPEDTRGKGLCLDQIEKCENGNWKVIQEEALPTIMHPSQACAPVWIDFDYACTGKPLGNCECENGDIREDEIQGCQQRIQVCSDGKWGHWAFKNGVGCVICDPGQTQSCDTNKTGRCKKGTQTCTLEGNWGVCISNDQPITTGVCISKHDSCSNAEPSVGSMTCQNLPERSYVKGELTCGNTTGTLNESGCVTSQQACGDGVKDAWEQCDNGSFNTDTPPSPEYNQDVTYCTTSCKIQIVPKAGYCGDGILDLPYEECELGMVGATSQNCVQCQLNQDDPSLILGTDPNVEPLAAWREVWVVEDGEVCKGLDGKLYIGQTSELTEYRARSWRHGTDQPVLNPTEYCYIREIYINPLDGNIDTTSVIMKMKRVKIMNVRIVTNYKTTIPTFEIFKNLIEVEDFEVRSKRNSSDTFQGIFSGFSGMTSLEKVGKFTIENFNTPIGVNQGNRVYLNRFHEENIIQGTISIKYSISICRSDAEAVCYANGKTGTACEIFVVDERC